MKSYFTVVGVTLVTLTMLYVLAWYVGGEAAADAFIDTISLICQIVTGCVIFTVGCWYLIRWTLKR